jgi:hypothetical protein
MQNWIIRPPTASLKERRSSALNSNGILRERAAPRVNVRDLAEEIPP